MAYIKNIWVDQDVERPKTYEVTNNEDGSITLTDSFGLVTELGTPVNETNMNHIEDGIDGCAIRKHNLTETFNSGEWVLGGTGDDKGIYESLVADNVGNAVTDTTKWEKVEMGGGASRNIGEIVTSTIPLTDAGLHLLDGALISGSGSYSAFVDYIADLYDSGSYTAIFDTEANWQAAVTANGVCGKFVYDSVNNTVRLPKITGILEGTTDLTALGDLVEAGLPNITGQTGASSVGNRFPATGAFSYRSDMGNNTYGSSGSGAGDVVYMDASNSSPIYGNSNTVQPQTIKILYYIVIATSTKTDIEVDIDEIATDLNGKADVDLLNAVPTNVFGTALDNANIRTVVKTYKNGASWYRIYSDKWCIQGSSETATTTHQGSTKTVYLLKNFADTNYAVAYQPYTTYTSALDARYNQMNSKSTDKFTMYYNCDCTWIACGYVSSIT